MEKIAADICVERSGGLYEMVSEEEENEGLLLKLSDVDGGTANMVV